MAAGSHATWSPGDQRTCAICGQPLRITKDTLWIHTNDLTGEHSSSHVACGPPFANSGSVPGDRVPLEGSPGGHRPHEQEPHPHQKGPT